MENPRLVAGMWFSASTGIAMSLLGLSLGSAQDFFGLDLARDSLFLLIVFVVAIFFAGELLVSQSKPGFLQLILTGTVVPATSLISFIFCAYFLDAIGVIARSGALHGNLDRDISQSVQILQMAWLICSQYALLIPIGIFSTWALTLFDSMLGTASELRRPQ